MEYRPRVIEAQIDELIAGVPALEVEGAKAVGKTATAARRAKTVFELDDPAQREIVRADPARLTRGEPPILIDEWQRYLPSWDLVRRAVDQDRAPGRFLLTGSFEPSGDQPIHSGAGRIVSVRMRPMTLPERGVTAPTVSFAALLAGERPTVEGKTPVGLEDYVREILRSGFPGLQRGIESARREELNGYIDRIVAKDFPMLGHVVRNPPALRRWMTAYAAATATTASYESIRDAATSGSGEKPARTTTAPYHDALEHLRIVEPLPAWTPSGISIGRLSAPPKHHLVDPALAARLLNVSDRALLKGRDVGPRIPRKGTLLGALFESLTCLTVRVLAQAAGSAPVFHFRTRAGEREVDLIVEAGDDRVLALEVKLSHAVDESDGRHLRWLRGQLGDRLADAVIISTGPEAYRRREDGIAVVPLSLLGA